MQIGSCQICKWNSHFCNITLGNHSLCSGSVKILVWEGLVGLVGPFGLPHPFQGLTHHYILGILSLIFLFGIACVFCVCHVQDVYSWPRASWLIIYLDVVSTVFLMAKKANLLAGKEMWILWSCPSKMIIFTPTNL